MTMNEYPYGPQFQHIHPYHFAYDQRTSHPYTAHYPYPYCFYFYSSPYRAEYPYGEGYSAYPPTMYPRQEIVAQHQQTEAKDLESTPQGFSIKLNNPQEDEEVVTQQENGQSENAQGFHINTGGEIGGKHGVGFHADGHIDGHGVNTQASSHLGEEKYGLGVHGKAGLNASKGLNFDTGGQLGGKYGIDAHANGHLSLSQGIALNTEAQLGGNHGIGAHINGQVGGQGAELSTGANLGGDHGLGVHATAHLGGDQGAALKTKAQIGGDHGLGVHAKAQMGGGQGTAVTTGAQIGGDHGLGAHAKAQFGGSHAISFKVGGNIGNHDGQLGINIGSKDKKQKES
ncbi:hypothetical protein UB51_23355 [Paenibacillus sp. IHBB 10380]|nr:hypothetical protein UB51_23355 [Paenibacillus sp. IHBB 10380]